MLFNENLQQVSIVYQSLSYPQNVFSIHFAILTNGGLPTLEHWSAALWLLQGLGPKRAHFSTALSIFHKSSLRQKVKKGWMSYFIKQPQCFEKLGKMSKSITTLDYRTLRNGEHYTSQCARKKLQLEEAVKVYFQQVWILISMAFESKTGI